MRRRITGRRVAQFPCVVRGGTQTEALLLLDRLEVRGEFRDPLIGLRAAGRGCGTAWLRYKCLEVHDFIRLVFAEDGEFKRESQPTPKHMAWWWGRGQNESLAKEQWHAFKRAALCSSDTISTAKGYFSLKKVTDDMRGWYS